jgi:uncharacterized protein YlxW (UPF0749 family)
MTDEQGQLRRPQPDRGMPTAGRRPELAPDTPEPADLHPVGEGPADDAPTSTPPAGADADADADEPTITVPGGPAADEPTMITPPGGAVVDQPAMVTPPGGRGADTEPGEATARLTPTTPAADDEPTVAREAAAPPPPDRLGPDPVRDEEPTVEGLRASHAARSGEPPAGVDGRPGASDDRRPLYGTAGDDEPIDGAAADEDGETVRLRKPAVVPGPAESSRAPEDDAPPAEAAGDDAASVGSPDVVNAGAAGTGDDLAVPEKGEPKPAPWRRLSSAGALIWVLLALFGFTLVVQLRSNSADEGLATARQEDLVRILSDLEARDQRLQAEITTLEQSQRQLTSGVEGRQAALAEADKRADELGLLAGTVAGRGPGLRVVIDPKGQVKASAILNAVQELRGAGGEVMQINGAGGDAVRIVASTYFVDAGGGGIVVDTKLLTGPYTLSVIGVPQTMQTALQIPGGVVASVNSAGGSVTMETRSMVEVTAVRKATSLQYARPVS